MASKYGKREIGDVYAGKISVYSNDEGKETATGTVEFTLKSSSGDIYRGEKVTMVIQIPAPKGTSIRDLQNQLITSAHDLIQRIAKEKLENWQEVLWKASAGNKKL